MATETTTIDSTSVEQEEEQIKKPRRGGRKRKGYFYEEQEKAVDDYIHATDQRERDRIFNTWLKPAFKIMVESLIRRYNLYCPDEEFEETFNDTLSWLMTKIDHFDASKGFKAYSYCGTVCKNHLLHKLNEYGKYQDRYESYDNADIGLDNSLRYSTTGSGTDIQFLTELMKRTANKVKDITEHPLENKLNQDEIKVGNALVELLLNWDAIFDKMGSNKFNKSSVLLFLRENTALDTTAIRNCMKKYKAAYYDIKERMVQYL